MRAIRASALAAVLAAGLSATAGGSSLGAPYRVADLNQGPPQRPDQVAFLGEAGGRALVFETGLRSDADEKGWSQEELWSLDPASGRSEPIVSFIRHSGYPEPRTIAAVRGR